MACFILGLFLLLAPFLLLVFFEDRKRGFIFIIFWIIVFQTALAFFSQLLGIFRYELILAVNIIAAAAILYRAVKNKYGKSPFSFNWNIDWVLIAAAAIFIFNLWQVHYNYTGEISLATDKDAAYHQVKNFKYPYPYYSDEWYAVALIKQNISSGALSFENPLAEGQNFVNFELFFHSFLSEIALLLKLNPLLDYAKISILINALIGVLIYLFLRIKKVGKFASAIAFLFLLYVVSASNLPGVWNLIPFTMGILAFLIGLCFMALKEKKMALWNLLPVFLFYPPLSVFYLISALTFTYARN